MNCGAFDSATKRIAQWTIILAMVTGVIGQTHPKISSVTFFDKYGAEVSLAYEGGHVSIECSRCTGTSKMELVDENNNPVSSAACDGQGGATLRLDLTKSTKFGRYRCRQGGTSSSDDFQYDYRTCAKDEHEYRDCSDQFCTISSKDGQPTPCSRPTLRSCENQHLQTHSRFRVCKSDKMSLCHTVAENGYEKAYVEQRGAACAASATDLEIPRIEYESKLVKQNEPIEIEAGKQIDVMCSGDAKSAELTCNLSRSDGSLLNSTVLPKCTPGGSFDLPADIFSRSNVYKFECYIKKPNYEAHMLAYLVTTAGKLTCSKIESGGLTHQINCKIDPIPPPSEFTVEYEITRPSGGKSSVKKMPVDSSENGDYVIEAKVVYVSLSPHKKITSPSQTATVSVANAAPTPIPIDATGISHPPGETDKSAQPRSTSAPSDSGVWWKVLVGVAAFVVVVVLCVVGWYCYFSRRRRQNREADERKRREESVRRRVENVERKHFNAQGGSDGGAQSRLPTGEANLQMTWADPIAIDLVGLQEELGHLAETAKKGEEAQADHIHQSFERVANDAWNSPTVTMFKFKDATEKQTPTLYTMESFYGDPILMGRIPDPGADVYSYLRACDQDKIGVIVVLGPTSEKDVQKTALLWATKLEGTTVHVDASKRRQYKVTTLMVTKGERGTTTYTLAVEHQSAGQRLVFVGFEKRVKIYVIQIPCNPEYKNHTSVAMFSEGIVAAVREQALQLKKGLPGVAVLCPDGLKISPTFIALFNSYQCYLHSEKTNPIGFQLLVHKYAGDQVLSVKSLGVQKFFQLQQFTFEVLIRLGKMQIAAETGRNPALKGLSFRDASTSSKSGRQQPSALTPPKRSQSQLPSAKSMSKKPVGSSQPPGQSRKASVSQKPGKSMAASRSPGASMTQKRGPQPGPSQRREPSADQSRGKSPSGKRV